MAHTKIRRRGKYIAELREIFEEADLDVDSVMTTRSQLLADDDQTVKNSVASYSMVQNCPNDFQYFTSRAIQSSPFVRSIQYSLNQ